MSQADLIINKANLADLEWIERETTPLEEGQVRLAIEGFSLTANNVTYAAFADFAGYWNFFPTDDESKGRVPFWGFANVSESRCEGVEVGQRFYGYYPASTDLIVTPGRLNPFSFTDVTEHRTKLPAIYNTYILTETDTAYQAEFEDVQMLVRPLYATGWLIDDCLRERENPPAHVVVSSASAKTSLGYASAAKKNGGITLTGLTSAGNIEFTKASGLYDHVVSYDDMESIVDAGPAVHVDIRGNPAMRAPLADAMNGQLKTHLQVGAADWQAPRGSALPTQDNQEVAPSGKVENEVFFAPGHSEVCAKRMGAKEMTIAMNEAMCAFYPVTAKMLDIETIDARSGLVDAWRETLDGKVSPARGLIIRF